MNCPNCGASTSQAPNGSWYCSNCGWSSGFAPASTVMSACPSCGGPAQPSGRGYLCPRCGYQSGVSPAVQWLEARPINAYNASEFGPTLRHDLFDEDCDYRGGSIRGLAQIKEDHRLSCIACETANRRGELVVVG